MAEGKDLRSRLETVQINLNTLKESTAAKLLPSAVLGTIVASERLLADLVGEVERLKGNVAELADIVAAVSTPVKKGVRHA